MRRDRGDVSWHKWGDCAGNVHSSRFDTNICLKVLNRTRPGTEPPQWYINECKSKKNLSPTNQQQQ